MKVPRMLIGFTGPSGSGKTTLAGLLQKHLTDASIVVEPVVSVTTRPPRAGETDGVSYYFVSPEEFDAQGDYVETLEFHGQRYGLTQQELERVWQRGAIPIVMLDPQGLEQAVKYCRTNDIFFLPVFVAAPRDKLVTRYLQRVYAEGEAKQNSDLAYHGTRLDSIYNEANTWYGQFLDIVGTGPNDPRVYLYDVEENTNAVLTGLANTLLTIVIGLQCGVKPNVDTITTPLVRAMVGSPVSCSDVNYNSQELINSKPSLEELQAEIVQWAHETFGHKRNIFTITCKLKEELKELQEAFEARDFTRIGEESADVQILLWDAMFLLGINPVTEVRNKLAINRQRRWNIGEDGVSRHA